MAIVSFWSNGNSETGKSSAIIALSTFSLISFNIVELFFYKDKCLSNAYHITIVLYIIIVDGFLKSI